MSWVRTVTTKSQLQANVSKIRCRYCSCCVCKLYRFIWSMQVLWALSSNRVRIVQGFRGCEYKTNLWYIHISQRCNVWVNKYSNVQKGLIKLNYRRLKLCTRRTLIEAGANKVQIKSNFRSSQSNYVSRKLSLPRDVVVIHQIPSNNNYEKSTRYNHYIL